jgi:hypothetical protein
MHINAVSGAHASAPAQVDPAALEQHYLLVDSAVRSPAARYWYLALGVAGLVLNLLAWRWWMAGR